MVNMVAVVAVAAAIVIVVAVTACCYCTVSHIDLCAGWRSALEHEVEVLIRLVADNCCLSLMFFLAAHSTRSNLTIGS